MGMNEEIGKVQYHYGFYGAIHAEYELSDIQMTFMQEYELGDQPLRMDMLIIKQNSHSLKDPVGSFFRTYNVLEYKSPEDNLSIDDFYKAQGYALIYKSMGKRVNDIPLDEITISIFRHTYPREMFSVLKKSGFQIEEEYPGVYYVSGSISVPVQIIVTSRLSEGTYVAFKALSKNARKEDILRLLKIANDNFESRIMTYVSAVLHVSLAINEKLFDELEEEGIMVDAIERVFKKEMEAKKMEGKEEVVTEMLRGNEPVDKIVRYTHLPMESIIAIAKKIGISTLVV